VNNVTAPGFVGPSVSLVTGRSGARLAMPALSVLIACGLCSCGGGPTVTSEPGVLPFFSLVHVNGINPSIVTGVQYTIASKPGSVSKPVHVEYSQAALASRGYTSSDSVTVPVFGLYAGYENHIALEVERKVGAPLTFDVLIQTDPYADPTGIYSQPTVLIPRAAGSVLGFDFIYIKSALGSPVIIDTDGQIRWAAPGVTNSISSTLRGDEFIIGDAAQPNVYRLRLDGTLTPGALPSGPYTDFNHDIAHGKQGVLAEVDAASDGISNIESNVIELTDGTDISILHRWDLGAILSAYMSSQGDDPTQFVRPGVDWFHSNSAIYDRTDDSLIVSSRENFVIKLDYETGAIIWILGDPSKYWYTFPSLRAKALTLTGGGLYPIGQHALSLTRDGLLMLFNDGAASLNQPAGQSAGASRNFSAVSAYSIDAAAGSATEVWDYDGGRAIYSAFCSSAYETSDKSTLVDYAVANNASQTLLVGLDPNRTAVFELAYPNYGGCNTGWNARPVPLDALSIR
jgi:arylsulfate sulfotransferase